VRRFRRGHARRWHSSAMHSRCKSCLYCKVVETVCYWEPLPVKSWKRPLLFATSAALTACSVVALRVTLDRGDVQFLSALSGLFMVFTLLGVAISFRGCDACVSRFLGKGSL
jgi:hypothetical protein